MDGIPMNDAPMIRIETRNGMYHMPSFRRPDDADAFYITKDCATGAGWREKVPPPIINEATGEHLKRDRAFKHTHWIRLIKAEGA